MKKYSENSFMNLSFHALLGDLDVLLLSKQSLTVVCVCFASALCALILSKYQSDTIQTYSYPGYILWIFFTRLGDAFLVFYPWTLCRVNFLGTSFDKKILYTLIFFTAASEFLFFTAPANKEEWENPQATTVTFKLLAITHYIWYFFFLFILPYQFSAPIYTIKRAKSMAPIQSHSLENKSIEKPSEPKFITTNEMEKSVRPQEYPKGQSFGAYYVSLMVVLYSFLAISLPFILNITLFELGPLVFIPVIILLSLDSKKTIHYHRGYCSLFTIFQLGIHALPFFIVRTLFKSNNGSASNIISLLAYYTMMTGYGHQWRLIAFHATSPYSHVCILVLFQVFDVIFSNMAFIGVQHFDFVYFFLIFCTFVRIFCRESKILNDIVYNLTNQDGNPIEMAILQCTRIRRARQSILLEVCSSILLPCMFGIDSITNWDVMVREDSKFNSLIFVLISSCIIFCTRLGAGASAWMYLKWKANKLLQRVEAYEILSRQKKQKAIDKSNEFPSRVEIEQIDVNISSISTPACQKNENEMSKMEFTFEERIQHINHLKKQCISEDYSMLYPQEFRKELLAYWDQHMLYICVGVAYGILNAVIFTGKINRDIVEDQLLKQQQQTI